MIVKNLNEATTFVDDLLMQISDWNTEPIENDTECDIQDILSFSFQDKEESESQNNFSYTRNLFQGYWTLPDYSPFKSQKDENLWYGHVDIDPGNIIISEYNELTNFVEPIQDRVRNLQRQYLLTGDISYWLTARAIAGNYKIFLWKESRYQKRKIEIFKKLLYGGIKINHRLQFRRRIRFHFKNLDDNSGDSDVKFLDTIRKVFIHINFLDNEKQKYRVSKNVKPDFAY